MGLRRGIYLMGLLLVAGLGFGQSISGQWWEKMKYPTGAAYVLVEGDSVVEAAGFGTLGKEGRNVDGQTVFRAGSLGKTVVAMGIMRLSEEGKLDLGKSMEEILSDIPIGEDYGGAAAITVGHLLEHTAGFDDMHFSEYYVEAPMPLAEALSEYPASKELRWKPGSRAAYSNIDYAMLALLGERVSGRPWKAWLEETVLKPLGMNRSGFGLPPADMENQAIGHVKGQALEENPLYRYAPSLSFYTCADDMGKLLACLNGGGGDLLNPSSVERLSQNWTAFPLGEMGKSLGAGLQRDYINGWRVHSHTGKVDGFSGLLEIFPGQSRAYAVLYNSQPKGGVRLAALSKGCRKWAMPLRKNIPLDPPILHDDTNSVSGLSMPVCFALANPRNELLGKYDRLMTTLSFRKGLWEAEIDGQRYHSTKGGALYRAGRIHVGAFQWQDRLQVGEGYFEKCPCWRAPLLRLLEQVLRWGTILLLLGMVAEAISPRFSGRKRLDLGLVFGVLPYWLAKAGFWILVNNGFKVLGSISLPSVAFFLISLLVPLLALAAVLRLFIYLRRSPQSLRWGILLPFATANIAMAYYMYAEGLVGMRLWAW